MILLAGITLVRHAFYGFSFAEVSGASYPYFRNHVNYGALLVCCMPMVWLLYKQDQNRWWFPALLLMAVALYFSYSRGAWLALPVGIMAAWLVRKGWLMQVVSVAMVLVCLGFAWLVRDNNYLQFRPDYASTIYHADLKDHMEATYSMKDLSTAERFYRWIAGWRMGEEHPLTGVGPNHFYPAYRSYTVQAFRTYVSDNPEHSTVHNYFLLLLSEQGFPALVIFLLLVWTLFYYAQRNYERYADAGQRRLLQAVVAILAMIMVLISLSDLIEADKIGPLFYTCIAVVIAAGSGAYIKGIPEAVAEEIE
jgi:O-antigen ligase